MSIADRAPELKARPEGEIHAPLRAEGVIVDLKPVIRPNGPSGDVFYLKGQQHLEEAARFVPPPPGSPVHRINPENNDHPVIMELTRKAIERYNQTQKTS